MGVAVGPGRVPAERDLGSQLPAAMAAALQVGKFCKLHEFGSTDTWCTKCCRWKPVLASHCGTCDRCSMWMDHHCFFAGQCVGHRNLRCFLCFLLSAQLLTAFNILCGGLRFLVSPLDHWERLWLSLFILGNVYFHANARGHTGNTLGRLSAGWLSLVMMLKYESISNAAREVQSNHGAEIRAGIVRPIVANIRQPWLRLVRPKGGLYGLFMPDLEYVFGEPLSWRWLLPFRSGGTDDPLQPTHVDENACET